MSSALGDLGSAVIIILIFMLLHFGIAASIGITNIQQNWQFYKCNPGIMPFAQVFGHDVVSNFNNCIKERQISYMTEYFLEPIYQSLSLLIQNGEIFTEIFEELKIFGNEHDSAVGQFSMSVGDALNNVSESISGAFSGINDVLNSIGTSFELMKLTNDGVVMTGTAAEGGLLGTLLGFISK